MKLGDVVEILAERNQALHQQLFYIAYLDPSRMKLMRTTDSAIVELKFSTDLSSGHQLLLDQSIDEMRVVSRSPEAGFARQHGLLPNTHVDLEFENLQMATGKITHLVHDQIEVSLTDETVLYIDFGYQGLPECLVKIRIRAGPPLPLEAPVSAHPKSTYIDHMGAATMEWSTDGEIVIVGLDDDAFSKSYHTWLETEYSAADQLTASVAVFSDSSLHHPIIATTTKKTLEGDIPIWDDTPPQNHEGDMLLDGIVIPKSDGEVKIVRRSKKDEISRWIWFPHPPPQTLLQHMETPPTSLWRLFLGQRPAIVEKKELMSDYKVLTTFATLRKKWPVLPPPPPLRLKRKPPTTEGKEEETVLSSAYENTSWSHILNDDFGAYYMTLVRLSTASQLTLSPEMTDTITDRIHKKVNDFEDMNQVKKIKATDSVRRVLAKRYTSLSDIHKDSSHKRRDDNDDVFFDPEYDDTPYTLLPELEKEFADTTANPRDFVDFVSHNLVDRYNYTPKMAQEVAGHMLAKKRRVQEGHYALLEPAKNDSFYYRRTHDHKWVLDKTVDATTFLDMPTLFSNLDKVCVRDAPEDVQQHLRYMEHRRNLRELQTRLTEAAVQTTENLEKLAERVRGQLRRRKILEHVKRHRFDHAITTPSSSANGVAESPHTALCHRILGDVDPVRKYHRVLNFVVRHCRESLEDESPHWMYCNETGFPLMPVSMYRLALGECDEAQQGKAEDGFYLDPFTGCFLGTLPFAHDDHPPGDSNDDETTTTTTTIGEETVQVAVLESMRRILKLPKDDTCMLVAQRVAQELVNEVVSEQQFKTKPRAMSFRMYRDREFILRAACALLFAVQTTAALSQDRRRLKKGYPLIDDEKQTEGGVSILSHLLWKQKSHKQRPWDSLKPSSEEDLREAIVVRCRTLLLTKPKYARELEISRQERNPPPMPRTRPPLANEKPLQRTLLDDGFDGHVEALVAQGNRKQHVAIEALLYNSWALAYRVVLYGTGDTLSSGITMGHAWQKWHNRHEFRVHLLHLEAEEASPPSLTTTTSLSTRAAEAAAKRYQFDDDPKQVPVKMTAIYLENLVSFPTKHLHKTQSAAVRDLLASLHDVVGASICQLLDAHLSDGGDDDSGMVLMHELAMKRQIMWAEMREWFGRDQLRRIHLVMKKKNLVRNLTRVYPRTEEDIPDCLVDQIRQTAPKRLTDLCAFTELATTSILDPEIVDSIHSHVILVIVQEYMSLATTPSMSHWMANLLSTWCAR